MKQLKSEIEKSNSQWIALVRQGYKFKISAVTKYEIYSGTSINQLSFLNNIFQAVEVIPFDETSAQTAADINNALKTKCKQIDIAGLFIAATAVSDGRSRRH